MVEYPGLGWQGRISYLSAKNERLRVESYAMDLLWVLAKGHVIKGDSPMPSDVLNNEHKIDRRSGNQILDDLIKKLKKAGGE